MLFRSGPSSAETITVNSQAMTASGIQAAIFQDAVDRNSAGYMYKIGDSNKIQLSGGKEAYITATGGVGSTYKSMMQALENGTLTKDTNAVTDQLKTPGGSYLSKANVASALLPTMNISGTSTVVANAAIDTINAAINAVSSYRAKLGAAQNRLEHTVNNLKVTSENITSAESRIRDTDMADEITAFTKNNILLQASQSMLAQSNSVPQSILSLLQ